MKNNDNNKLYSKKSKILMILCAFLALAVTVFCIILIANDKKDSGEAGTESAVETSGAATEDESYKTVDTSIVTEDVVDTDPGADTSDDTSAHDTDKPGGNDPGEVKGSLGEGLYLLSIEPYSGPFVEDGSDEPVENIMAATVKNGGSEPVQYVSISVDTGDGNAVFEATTIPVGSSVVILEKNKAQYTGGGYMSAEITSCIRFIDEPSFHSDVVSVDGADGQLIIENIGTENIENKVAVYYKSVKDGKYFGGITYSATIDGGIAAGDSVIVNARHFKINDSRLMFVIYD